MTLRFLVVVVLVTLLLNGGSVAQSQPVDVAPAGIGASEEGSRPVDPDDLPAPPVEEAPLAATATPVFANGVFSGPTPWNLNAVNAYKAQANVIRQGDFTSQVSFLPQEISSWDQQRLQGGVAYAVTVISGLQPGDIVHKTYQQEFTYDYTNGTYSRVQSEDPVDNDRGSIYFLIEDYQHNPGSNRIIDWINYAQKEADGSYTLITTQGVFWILDDVGTLPRVVGYGFRMSENYAVYRGGTLANPQISQRGYRFSLTGVEGGAVLTPQPTYRNDQNVVAAPVTPLLECVADTGDGMLTAHFGYNNRNIFPLDIDVGAENGFAPGPEDREQPKEFAAGRSAAFPDNPFSVNFAADTTLAWTLDGTTVTASASSPACAPIEVIRPIVECVAQQGDTYTAFFGYENANDYVANVPIGTENAVSPGPQAQGQPTTFAPGLRTGALAVDFTGNAVSWTVNGQVATASRESEPCEPTAVTLRFFDATVDDGAVVLTWETATEIDNAGFNLYRATSADGPFTPVNTTLIPATGDALNGGTYRFTDTPGTGTFFYLLEDVDLNGVQTAHGPISVRFGAAPAQTNGSIYLPLVVK